MTLHVHISSTKLWLRLHLCHTKYKHRSRCMRVVVAFMAFMLTKCLHTQRGKRNPQLNLYNTTHRLALSIFDFCNCKTKGTVSSVAHLSSKSIGWTFFAECLDVKGVFVSVIFHLICRLLTFYHYTWLRSCPHV